jgi:hypothetical protein
MARFGITAVQQSSNPVDFLLIRKRRFVGFRRRQKYQIVNAAGSRQLTPAALTQATDTLHHIEYK